MARYFVSYIEQNGHANLIVSELADGEVQPKVVTELGFLIKGDSTGMFVRNLEGVVLEESNVSRLVYGGAKGKHRTYEITKSELELLLNKVNQDRRIDAPVELGEYDDFEYAGGPTYQLFLHNCKNYALEVLNHIGVTDINRVRNLAVQNPNAKSGKLTRMQAGDFHCPKKDAYIAATKKLFIRIEDKLTELEAHMAKVATDNETRKRVLEKVSNVQEVINTLRKNMHKVGYSDDFIFGIDTLNDQLTDLQVSGYSTLDFGRSDNKSIASQLHEDLYDLSDETERLKDATRLLARQYNNGTASFYWRQIPKLSPRANLSNFSDTQVAIYGVQLYLSESQAYLDDLYSTIKNMAGLNEIPVSGDMARLIEYIETAHADINQLQNEFLKFNSTNNDEANLDYYRNTYQKAKGRMEQLERNVAAVQSSEANVNLIKRIIISIMKMLNMTSSKYIEPNIAYLKGKVKRPAEVKALEITPPSFAQRLKAALQSLLPGRKQPKFKARHISEPSASTESSASTKRKLEPRTEPQPKPLVDKRYKKPLR